MKALITGIKRFAVHDGDGIRSTVFFKGCSLRCKWCHNPENISSKYEIGLFSEKCTLCGKCAEICKNHTVSSSIHTVDRKNCTFCGKCTAACPSEAITVYGKSTDTYDICCELLKDKDFYEAGGGITLSGGECLLQPDACVKILECMKQNGINTAVDTAGNVPWKNIAEVFTYTDTFLYDIKHIDSGKHFEGTGSGNELILENLTRISKLGGSIEIRMPIIPGYNDSAEAARKTGEFLKGISGITKIRLLPYHNFAGSKYLALGLENTLTYDTCDKTGTAREILQGMKFSVV